MTYARHDHIDDPDTLPRMPSWVTSARVETLEDVAFLSGAALCHLHLVLGQETLPHSLLRARLALSAAESSMVLSGRPERAGELRDEHLLLRPGDQLGPGGAIYLQWQRAVARRISVAALHRALPLHAPERIANWLDARSSVNERSPVAQAASVMEAVLQDAPRAETAALILGEVSLARACGWDWIVPLLALGMKSRDLRKTGDELQLACHRAVIGSTRAAVQLAHDLTRRVARLNAALPKLRAKGAGEAVQIFLSQDAVAPSALPLADRAARRFCDRLVALGVVRELTGRDTFRLYGV